MIILDASVVVKWFSEEEYTRKSLGDKRKNGRGKKELLCWTYYL